MILAVDELDLNLMSDVIRRRRVAAPKRHGCTVCCETVFIVGRWTFVIKLISELQVVVMK
jgi:hypothetical protein